jgi:hypothetical protein
MYERALAAQVGGSREVARDAGGAAAAGRGGEGADPGDGARQGGRQGGRKEEEGARVGRSRGGVHWDGAGAPRATAAFKLTIVFLQKLTIVRQLCPDHLHAVRPLRRRAAPRKDPRGLERLAARHATDAPWLVWVVRLAREWQVIKHPVQESRVAAPPRSPRPRQPRRRGRRPRAQRRDLFASTKVAICTRAAPLAPARVSLTRPVLPSTRTQTCAPRAHQPPRAEAQGPSPRRRGAAQPVRYLLGAEGLG